MRNTWEPRDGPFSDTPAARRGYTWVIENGLSREDTRMTTGQIAIMLALMGPGRGVEKVLGEHRAIFEAIRDRQAETARTLMRRHLEGSRDRLFEGRMLDLSL